MMAKGKKKNNRKTPIAHFSDGTNSGFDIELINHIRNNVTIPVIASSGAGKVGHFSEIFEKTDVEAALGAGIFHREEVPIETVKAQMLERGIETRAK